MPVEEEREVKISDYYYKKSDIDTQMNNKVDKDGNKVLSDNNYTNADKAKLTNMTPADYVTSSSLSSILSSYVVTSTLNNYYTQDEIQSALSNKADNTTVSSKVDKDEGASQMTDNNDYSVVLGLESYSTQQEINQNIIDNIEWFQIRTSDNFLLKFIGDVLSDIDTNYDIYQ